MGRIDRSTIKIFKTERDGRLIPFNQPAPYYARKGDYYSSKNNFSKALLFFRKAVQAEPSDPWNHYGLACLLSRVGKYQEANQVFRHIVQNLDQELTECYFYMAVNFGMMEDLPEAKRYLVKYLELSPEGDLGEEAEDLLLTLEEEEDIELFNRNLSAVENETLLRFIRELGEVKFRERLLENDSFFRTLEWGLYQGGEKLKEAVLKLYGDAGSESARQGLLDFVSNPWVSERLRQIALQELKRGGTGEKVRVFREGQFTDLALQEAAPPAPLWENSWQQVLECTFENMRRSGFYSKDFFDDAEAIWLDYINHIYPAGPRITDPRSWAAGLEYCLSRYHFLNVTQKELAVAYGLSASAVQRRFAEFNRVLEIDRKANRDMLEFLSKPKDQDS